MKINELFESALKASCDYEPVLSNAADIMTYMASFADDIDEERVEEYFRDCKAVLKLVPISSLKAGPAFANAINPKKQKRYLKMDPKTIPPIIVENGIVIDGNHRLRTASALGLKEIWAYVVEPIQ